MPCNTITAQEVIDFLSQIEMQPIPFFDIQVHLLKSDLKAFVVYNRRGKVVHVDYDLISAKKWVDEHFESDGVVYSRPY